MSELKTQILKRIEKLRKNRQIENRNIYVMAEEYFDFYIDIVNLVIKKD